MDIVIQHIKQIGEVVTPIILTALFVIVVVISIKKKWDAIKDGKKWSTTLNLLEKLVSKNTCEDDVKTLDSDVKTLVSELKDLKESLKNDESVTHDQTATLGQMIGVIFENSTLPMETKERLRTLKTKIEYASDSKAVEELIAENSKLKKKYSKVKEELTQAKKQSEPEKSEADITQPEEPISNLVIQ
jgi:uncharacterized protein YlxW (UPF0749 family)